MKLFHCPGTCSTGIHLLLHEIGAPFDTEIVNLREGAQHGARFQAISTKGKVPTLVRDDGSVLTEFQTIAMWLAKAHPQSKLLPDTPDGETRVQEALDYMVGTVHMRGYTFILATGKFLSDPAGQAALQDHGRAIVMGGFARLAAQSASDRDRPALSALLAGPPCDCP